MIGEPDPLLRRLQTGALVWCGALVAGSLAFFPDRPGIAGGILGGGLLTAVSFYAITSSIDTLLALVAGAAARPAPDAAAGGSAGPAAEAPAAPAPTPKVGASLFKLVSRYGLLALLAYVMIARLRLHPIGVIVGASSLVAAASFEAVRGLSRALPRRPGR